METKTKDMKVFHKLVRNNRKKGTDKITELSTNGNDYKGEVNVVKAFQDHFRKLATFSKMICSIVIPWKSADFPLFMDFIALVISSALTAVTFLFRASSS
jgi:hypothetical protein